MLPEKIRFDLFDRLSTKTMRYVHAVPRHKATGLVKQVYDMIAEDFFINGSLTGHSKVPELLAGVWFGGCETILVDDFIDQTTKQAIAATMSSINDCPYCGDMLISLVHSAGDHQAAGQILEDQEEHINDKTLRKRLLWVKAVASPEYVGEILEVFNKDELPEVIGSIMAMSHINRFSHVVMDGSPVKAPFGKKKIKQIALRIFGNELVPTKLHIVEPGRSLALLPKAKLPDDLTWTKSNPRIADALSRWANVIEEQSQNIISNEVKKCVQSNLELWQGEQMPISRHWVEQEIPQLKGSDKDIARLSLILAKAPYQLDDKVVQTVFDIYRSEEQFIRILAWAAFTSARNIARRVSRLTETYEKAA